MADDQIIWGIHAGSKGTADSLFLQSNFIAIGWDEAGDIGQLEPNRDAFKAKISETYSGIKSGTVPVWAGVLYRFVHEIQKEDLVVYPSKADRYVHIGKVTGHYKYDPSISSDYPNLRPVRWLKSISRSSFSQGALYEIGSAVTLFQVRNYANEFLSVLESGPLPPAVVDPTLDLVVSDIEETTRDFILKVFARELKGHPFSRFVASLLRAMGYQTRVAPPGPDGGVDIVAHQDELGFQPSVIKVQVKSEEGSIGDPTLSSLYGKVEPGEFGLFVTLGTFTKPAKDFARNRTNLRLIDGNDLVNLLFRHYDKLDSQYRALIPLKNVYIPDVIGNGMD